MTLKVGYDIFAEPTQAGTDDGTAGLLCAETASSLKHKVRVTRSSDGYYWNATSGAFQSGATAEADELDFVGSFSPTGANSGSAIRRIKMRTPKALKAAVASGTATFQVYVTGASPSTGKSIVVDFASL